MVTKEAKVIAGPCKEETTLGKFATKGAWSFEAKLKETKNESRTKFVFLPMPRRPSKSNERNSGMRPYLLSIEVVFQALKDC